MVNYQRPEIKLLFPAGLISLIFLPGLCIWYLMDSRIFDKPRTMEITWWSNSFREVGWDHVPFEVRPERQYTDIRLNGDRQETRVKLDFAQLALREFVSAQDTVKGICFHFGDNATYGEFIKVLDLCKIEKVRHYIVNENNIWVFNYIIPRYVKRENPSYFDCGTQYMRLLEETRNKEKQHRARQLQTNYPGILKTFIPSLVAFMMMGISFIFKYHKR